MKSQSVGSGVCCEEVCRLVPIMLKILTIIPKTSAYYSFSRVDYSNVNGKTGLCI